ncbi:MAG: Sip1-related alpha-galactosidase [Ignavibacteriaceae bacterium]
MKISRYILCFCIAAAIFSQACGSDKEILVKSSGNKIDVYYGGKIRLQGGHFLLQSKDISVIKIKEKNGAYSFFSAEDNSKIKPVVINVKKASNSPVVTFFLSPNENQSVKGRDFSGFFFDRVPGFNQGVMLWRYGPWNSWSEPIRIDSISNLKDYDIQFFYWQCSDGTYGAAMPLSGEGYRTTLGRENELFGSKSVCYLDNIKKDYIPQMAVGFGKNPYQLFASLYKEGLKKIGKKDNIIGAKTFPKVLENIGWCTWNGSEEGRNLNAEFLLNAAKDFKTANFPVKWFLVDDGWFNNSDSKLNSFQPDKTKFPNGFKPVIDKLKREYKLSDFGIWHAYDGYWQGINPDSELGREYKKDLFSWKEKIRPDIDSSGLRTCYFISPFAKSLNKFYEDFHKYLKSEGFSFIKVDNQLETERMAVNNFPIFTGAAKYHEALISSAKKYFNNTIINCMDMTPDAYLNFGATAVARSEDDYSPAFEKGHTGNFWMEKAAEHIQQAVYNSLYFSQMVYCDFDMLESINPNAVYHAVARAINNGPVYITDKIGEHNYDVLSPLVYSDGKILRSGKPLLPAEDCLFQVKQPKPFKAFSMDGNTGLLGIWNCADSNEVKGTFKPSDVFSIKGEKFVIYEYFSKSLKVAGRDEDIPVALNGFGYKLFYIVPLINNNAVIGLVNKYNAPAAVLNSEITVKEIKALLYEGGTFAAYVNSRPLSAEADGKDVPFDFSNGLVTINIPVIEKSKHIQLDIKLN